MTTYFLRRPTVAAPFREPACIPGRLVLRWVAVTLAILLPLVAAAFAVRAVVGALASRFDDLACAVSILALALAAIVTRAELLFSKSRPDPRWRRFVLFAPSMSFGLLLVAAWGRMPPGVALLGAALVLTEEAFAWRRLTENARRDGSEIGPSRETDHSGEEPREGLDGPTNDVPPSNSIPLRSVSDFEVAEQGEEAEEDAEDESIDFPPDATQRLQRGMMEGRDALHGLGRVAFAAQQTHASLHIAFCPPFARTPHFEAAAIAGPDVQVTAALVEPFGVRMDVRLARAPAQPDSVVIEFLATLAE